MTEHPDALVKQADLMLQAMVLFGSDSRMVQAGTEFVFGPEFPTKPN